MPPAQHCPGEDKLDNNEVTHSVEVSELLEELRGAREADAVTAADLGQAESVLSGLTAQRGRLEGQLRAGEEALALSGAMPAGPFPEEQDILDTNRRIRVAKARVQLIGGKLAESRANIERLEKRLRSAWGEFITSRLAEVRARYRTTALALRHIYAEQMPWLHCAQLARVKVPAADVALIADPEATGGKNGLLDSREYAQSDAAWLKLTGSLHSRLTALHAQVTAAIGETKAQREARPAPAPTRTFGPGSLETLAIVMEGRGAATGASPAEAGSPLPDLAERGLSGGNLQDGGAWAGSPAQAGRER